MSKRSVRIVRLSEEKAQCGLSARTPGINKGRDREQVLGFLIRHERALLGVKTYRLRRRVYPGVCWIDPKSSEVRVWQE